MTERRVTTPLNDDVVDQMRSGDKVRINGIIYTGRDAAHKRLVDLLEKGESLPFDIQGQIIYFVGPTPARPGKPVAGAQVAFLDAAGQPIERRMTVSNVFGGGAATDAGGRLVQTGLPAGQVTVVVTTSADLAPISRTVTVRAGATERVDITAN